MNNRFTDWPNCLLEYSRESHELLYYPPHKTTPIYKYLNNKITAHSKQSACYTGNTIVTKDDLRNLDSWAIEPYSRFLNNTSGSTNSKPFQYYIWSDIYRNIESYGHYKLVSDEFRINPNPNIAYFLLTSMPRSNELYCTYRTNNVIKSHGHGKSATVYEIMPNSYYFANCYEFYEQVLRYLSELYPDILLISGGLISSLAWNARRLHWNKPICKLLSVTNQKSMKKDLIWLRENQLVTDWCDHMRCWDGGATFFTCRHYTYHLVDSLCWTYSDNQFRLICTDYFSLPSPFVRYWNGDYAQIHNQYQQCKCGRWFRPFQLGRTRDFTSHDSNLGEFRTYAHELGLTNGIKRIEYLERFLRIYTYRTFDIQEKSTIRQLMPQFNVNFITEEPNG